MFQENFKEVSRELQGCFKEVFRVFHRSFKCNSRKFQECFKKVLRVHQESFKGVSRKFQGCFKGDLSRMFQGSFQGCFEGALRVFQGTFKDLSRVFYDFQGCFHRVFQVSFKKSKFHVAWHSSQLKTSK